MPDNILSQSSVLVIVAHPDDEVLGCGGTIARHCVAGDRVAVLILADGVTSRGDVAPADLKERQSAAGRANAILGVQDVTLLTYPDNRMDEVTLLDIVRISSRSLRDASLTRFIPIMPAI